MSNKSGLNLFSGLRNVFDAADALKRTISSVAEPDGNPHSTIARGLCDASGNIVATADKTTPDGLTPLPFVLTSDTPIPFHATVSLTSAAAATAVTVIDPKWVPAGKAAYVTGFIATVNGATAWGTTATVALQDTASVPVAQATLAVAGLTANATLFADSADATLGNGVLLGTGATPGAGLVVVGNANGTGSALVVTVWGFFK